MIECSVEISSTENWKVSRLLGNFWLPKPGDTRERRYALKQFDRIMGAIEDLLGVLFLIGMVLLIFLQVILRSVFGHALNWSEEAARYLMIWCTGFGISASVRIGGNIGIQAIVDALPNKIAYWVRLVCELLTLAIFGFLTYSAWAFMMTAVQSGQLTPSLQVPIFYVYAALPVSFAFCALRQIQVLIMQYIMHIETQTVSPEIEVHAISEDEGKEESAQ